MHQCGRGLMHIGGNGLLMPWVVSGIFEALWCSVELGNSSVTESCFCSVSYVSVLLRTIRSFFHGLVLLRRRSEICNFVLLSSGKKNLMDSLTVKSVKYVFALTKIWQKFVLRFVDTHSSLRVTTLIYKTQIFYCSKDCENHLIRHRLSAWARCAIKS